MEKIPLLPRPVWAEINLKNIVYNFTQIRKYIPQNIKIMGVVKADAYGHGIKEVAKVLAKCGIDYFGVASLEEALQLKGININKPILILGYTEPEPAFIKEIINNSFRQTVYNKAQLQILNKYAKELNKLAKIHIEIDTGMGRLGVFPNEALDFIRYASELKNIKIEGLFTHFSVADSVCKADINYTKRQLTIFKNIIDKLEIDIIHAANSGAILNHEEAYFDLVRCGIMLYGLYPNEKLKDRITLQPALSVKAKIISVKEFEKGSYISYRRKYKTRMREKIALLPIGYQDGLSRLLSNNGYCLLHDKRCDIVGVICMDFTAINVTNTNAEIGDEVIIIGSGEKEEISADTIAKKINTINYEIVTVIGKLLPRVYLY